MTKGATKGTLQWDALHTLLLSCERGTSAFIIRIGLKATRDKRQETRVEPSPSKFEIIRPVRPDELRVFDGAATHSEHVDAVHDYVSDLLMNGSMRTEWCYVAESRGRAIGRAAFWTLPKMSHPLDLVFLDVPWETEGAYEIGVNLLQELSYCAFT